MDSVLSDRHEEGADHLQEVPQFEMVVCPGCRQTVPKKVFCPSCGYPQYLEGVGWPSSNVQGDFDLRGISDIGNIEQQVDTFAETKSVDNAKSEPANLMANPTPEEGAKRVDPGENAKQNGLFSSMRRFMGFEKSSNQRNEERAESQVLMVSSKEGGTEGLKGVEAPVEEITGVRREAEAAEGAKGVVKLDSLEPIEMAGAPQEPILVEPLSGRGMESSSLFEPDPESIDVQRGLLQGVSMELWLVSLLEEGGVDGLQFEKMFRDYEAQLSDCVDQREKMLGRSRDTGSVERALREARVYLEELKMRRTIGRVSEEEYGLKARALEWDIDHYEGEISRRKSEVEFLEDPTRVMPMDEVNRLKEMAERCKWAMDNITPDSLSSETSSRVRDCLQRTLDLLETLRLPSN